MKTPTKRELLGFVKLILDALNDEYRISQACERELELLRAELALARARGMRGED